MKDPFHAYYMFYYPYLPLEPCNYPVANLCRVDILIVLFYKLTFAHFHKIPFLKCPFFISHMATKSD